MQPVMPSAIQRVFISVLVKPMARRVRTCCWRLFWIRSRPLLADIAYAAKARLLDRLEQHQVEAVIPPKSNQKEPWEFDQDKYRWRHLIENFFAKLKQYRGIATRYDKRACAFLGAIHWVAAVIWLN